MLVFRHDGIHGKVVVMVRMLLIASPDDACVQSPAELCLRCNNSVIILLNKLTNIQIYSQTLESHKILDSEKQ